MTEINNLERQKSYKDLRQLAPDLRAQQVAADDNNLRPHRHNAIPDLSLWLEQNHHDFWQQLEIRRQQNKPQKNCRS